MTGHAAMFVGATGVRPEAVLLKNS